jgi:hypothetical protein
MLIVEYNIQMQKFDIEVIESWSFGLMAWTHFLHTPILCCTEEEYNFWVQLMDYFKHFSLQNDCHF